MIWRYGVKIISFAIIQIIIGIVLYRFRVISSSRMLQSDTVVFGLPLFAGFLAYCILFWTAGFAHSMPTRICLMLLTSLLAAGIASFACILIAFNIHGT